MLSTLEWLRGRTDAELAELLTARPDLLVPAPPDLWTLARRMDTPSAANRALAAVTAFEGQIVLAVTLLQPAGGPASCDEIAAFLGGPATSDEVAAGIERLSRVGLLISDGDGADVPVAVRDALGRYPAGLGPVDDRVPTDNMAEILSGLADDQRAVLELLTPGPPVGSFRRDSSHAPAVESLVAAGLLIRIDAQTVALPRAVGLALRGEQPLGPALPSAPHLDVEVRPPDTVDGTAAGQALAAHARAVRLLDTVGEAEIGQLKSGGIGIVTVRRLAKDLDTDPHIVTLYLEILHAAGLLAPVLARSGSGGIWLPTQAADTFLRGDEGAGWALLASAWWQLRRDPSMVGERDGSDKVRNALSEELAWRGGPADRHRIAGEIAALPPGSGASPQSLAARLAYCAPRRDGTSWARVCRSIMAEATELGVVAFNALSTAGRALLDDDVEGAAAAMNDAAPEAVESVLVQADMTVVAPGRLTRDLRDRLAAAAEVESSGSATVYRVTEASLGRAFDTGATRRQLHALFEEHSVTPVPQSLTYLIDDVARRHGVLRAGAAGSYLRSEDPALLAQAVSAASAAGLHVVALAPTVAACEGDVTALVDAVRAKGLTVAAEDLAGSVLDLRAAPRRARMAMPPRVPYLPPVPPSEEQVESVVRRMRAGDTGASGPQEARDIVTVLRAAATARSAVWIRYADAQGTTSKRIVEPIVVSGGTMVAFDRLRHKPETFPLHRIASVTPEE